MLTCLDRIVQESGYFLQGAAPAHSSDLTEKYAADLLSIVCQVAPVHISGNLLRHCR